MLGTLIQVNYMLAMKILVIIEILDLRGEIITSIFLNPYHSYLLSMYLSLYPQFSLYLIPDQQSFFW